MEHLGLCLQGYAGIQRVRFALGRTNHAFQTQGIGGFLLDLYLTCCLVKARGNTAQ